MIKFCKVCGSRMVNNNSDKIHHYDENTGIPIYGDPNDVVCSTDTCHTRHEWVDCKPKGFFKILFYPFDDCISIECKKCGKKDSRFVRYGKSDYRVH
jgi:hypothetical protein